METKKRGALIAVLLAASLCFSAPAWGEVIELKLGHHIPPQAGLSKILVQWTDNITAKTNGRIKFTHYPSQSLVRYSDAFDGCVGGVADIVFLSHTQSDLLRLSTVADLPALGWGDNDKLRIKVMNELLAKVPAMQKARRDVETIFFTHITPNLLHTTRKVVRTPADMRGLKITANGKSEKFRAECLHSIPLNIDMNERYMALNRGVVDSVITPWCVLYTHKQFEVTKCHLQIDLAATGFSTLMNKEKWDTLPPDIQKIIKQEAEMPALAIPAEMRRRDDLGRNKCKELGHSIIQPTAEEQQQWNAALKPMWDEWVKEQEAKGLPGRQVLDTTLELIRSNSQQ